MPKRQSEIQADVRLKTGTTGTFNEDFMALFNQETPSTIGKTWNEAFRAWYEERKPASGGSLGAYFNDIMENGLPFSVLEPTALGVGTTALGVGTDALGLEP